MNLHQKALTASSIIISGQRFTPEEYRASVMSSQRATPRVATGRPAPSPQSTDGRKLSMANMLKQITEAGLDRKGETGESAGRASMKRELAKQNIYIP